MKNTQSKYTRMAHIYDWVEQRMPMNDFKKQAVNLLQGKILEVGIGSGANLKFYKKDSDVTGIDFSTGMLEIAKEKINTLNLNNV
ncbi:MAG: class I SAM-dependent methyltransferase, partial [Cetobacterium sp.]